MLLAIPAFLTFKEKSKIYTKIINIQYEFPRRNKFNLLILGTVIYIIILNSFYTFNVVISNLVFLPHILKNLKKDFLPWYLLSFVIVVQMLITLYFTYFSQNFLVWKPDYLLSLVVVVVCFLQLALVFGFRVKKENRNELQVPMLNCPSSPELIALVLREERPCGICLSILNNQDIIITPCQHAYHNGCLNQWIAIHPVCPICRNSIQRLLRI